MEKRTILFKAKRVDNGKWVEGFYVFTSNKYHQILTGKWSNKTGSHHSFEVHPETVCQFTGLTDKNGVKIFEGDILKHRYKDDVKGVVSFFEGAFVVGIAVTFNALINFNAPKNLEVIGNIHDL